MFLLFFYKLRLDSRFFLHLFYHLILTIYFFSSITVHIMPWFYDFIICLFICIFQKSKVRHGYYVKRCYVNTWIKSVWFFFSIFYLVVLHALYLFCFKTFETFFVFNSLFLLLYLDGHAQLLLDHNWNPFLTTTLSSNGWTWALKNNMEAKWTTQKSSQLNMYLAKLGKWKAFWKKSGANLFIIYTYIFT